MVSFHSPAKVPSRGQWRAAGKRPIRVVRIRTTRTPGREVRRLPLSRGKFTPLKQASALVDPPDFLWLPQSWICGLGMGLGLRFCLREAPIRDSVVRRSCAPLRHCLVSSSLHVCFSEKHAVVICHLILCRISILLPQCGLRLQPCFLFGSPAEAPFGRRQRVLLHRWECEKGPGQIY